MVQRLFPIRARDVDDLEPFAADTQLNFEFRLTLKAGQGCRISRAIVSFHVEFDVDRATGSDLATGSGRERRWRR